jgi:DNA mismatch repair protein MLH3
MDSIEPLPSETRVRLRSSQILTSLPQVVSELLQNSLDASARNIAIGIDTEEWTCWVRDDGHGISKDNMAALATSLQGNRYGQQNTSNAEVLRNEVG